MCVCARAHGAVGCSENGWLWRLRLTLTDGVGVVNRQTVKLADEPTKLVSTPKDCTAPMKTKNCGLKRDIM